MSRYTITDLRNELYEINYYSLIEGNIQFIKEQGRNGYQAIDEYRVLSCGKISCQRNIEGGTSKECALAAYQSSKYFNIQLQTREQAKVILILLDVSFDNDYHTLPSDICELLTKMAKITKYRKPKNANGSTARYFYQHLKKKIQINS